MKTEWSLTFSSWPNPGLIHHSGSRNECDSQWHADNHQCLSYNKGIRSWDQMVSGQRDNQRERDVIRLLSTTEMEEERENGDVMVHCHVFLLQNEVKCEGALLWYTNMLNRRTTICVLAPPVSIQLYTPSFMFLIHSFFFNFFCLNATTIYLLHIRQLLRPNVYECNAT